MIASNLTDPIRHLALTYMVRIHPNALRATYEIGNQTYLDDFISRQITYILLSISKTITHPSVFVEVCFVTDGSRQN